MSSLFNTINNDQKLDKKRGQQTLDKFMCKKFCPEMPRNENKLIDLLGSIDDRGPEAIGWREDDLIVTNVDVILSNRLRIAEAKTGWRMGEDGVRTYSTYRGGKLVTGAGAEAMRLCMGD